MDALTDADRTLLAVRDDYCDAIEAAEHKTIETQRERNRQNVRFVYALIDWADAMDRRLLGRDPKDLRAELDEAGVDPAIFTFGPTAEINDTAWDLRYLGFDICHELESTPTQHGFAGALAATREAA